MKTTRERGEACLSDFRLDRVAAAELAAADAEEARRHLDGCAMCAARLAGIEQARARFRAALPEQTFVARAVASRPPARPWRWLVPAFAAAAVIAVIVFARPRGEPDPDPDPGIRIKGGERLGFYVSRDGHVQPGASGDVLHPGDRVRFTVTTHRPSHVVIAGIDSAGAVTVYYPPGSRAVEVNVGPDEPLPDSFELDDVLGAERVVGVFCDAPIEVDAVRAAVRANLREVAGCRTDVVTWMKRAR